MPSPMRSACASRCQRRPRKSGAPCRTRACRRRPNRETLPMYSFEYHRPTSVADAVSLLKRAGDGVLMAGGMTLIPTLKQRLASPSDVIDLGGVKEPSRIFVDRGSDLVIGALTPHAEVAGSSKVKGWFPALAKLADS